MHLMDTKWLTQQADLFVLVHFVNQVPPETYRKAA